MTTSKTSRLLKHLQNGGSVTGKTALTRFGIYRLSSVMFRYKKRLGIVCEKVTRGDTTYGKYFINSKPKTK